MPPSPTQPARNSARTAENLARVKDRIVKAAQRAGRDPEEVQLLPVTKSVAWPQIQHLVELGEREFAESRVQILQAKAQALAALDYQLNWHFIGPLQRNKARKVIEICDVLHSVHSLQLLETISRIASELSRKVGIYLQMETTGESTKQGLPASALPTAVQIASEAPHIELLGLMGMGPFEDPGLVRTTQIFETMRAQARSLEASAPRSWRDGRCRLSMGMSRDLECAIAAGSTLVRVGSDLFV